MTIPYPRISPIALHIGPIQIRWYGIMYLVGYIVGYRLLRGRIKRGLLAMSEPDLDALIGYFVVGMLLGARLVYAIVYQPGHYLDEPLEFFRLWHGGLSFHGAMLGMTAACLVFAHRRRIPFWQLADALAYCGAPGLFFGRLGNFINGELYGRPSHLPWAMIFPSDPLHIPRHPSELYEALGEGVLVFLLLVVLQRRSLKRNWYRPGLLAAAFLMLYGTVRFLLEFTRQPDPQLGLVLGPFDMGQVLCAGMIVAGAILMAFLYRGERPEPPPAPDPARSG
jgi:phosphatidylglycerol:prolipoprotein diacylglycerol transferase